MSMSGIFCHRYILPRKVHTGGWRSGGVSAPLWRTFFPKHDRYAPGKGWPSSGRASRLNTETEIKVKKPIRTRLRQPLHPPRMASLQLESSSVLNEAHQVVANLLSAQAQLALLLPINTAHSSANTLDRLHERIQKAPLPEVYVVRERLV